MWEDFPYMGVVAMAAMLPLLAFFSKGMSQCLGKLMQHELFDQMDLYNAFLVLAQSLGMVPSYKGCDHVHHEAMTW